MTTDRRLPGRLLVATVPGRYYQSVPVTVEEINQARANAKAAEAGAIHMLPARAYSVRIVSVEGLFARFDARLVDYHGNTRCERDRQCPLADIEDEIRLGYLEIGEDDATS